MHTWIRSAIVVIAIALVGIVGVWQAGNLVAERGTLGPSVLQSISPTFALFALVITIGVGALAGGLVAKISTTTTGMFIYGFAICAMAMRLEGATEFITNDGNYAMLLFEALLMSVLVLLGTIGVFAIGGPFKEHFKEWSWALRKEECLDLPDQQDSTPSQLGKTVLISLVVLPVLWIFANSPMKGQVLGASAVSGITVGLLYRQFLRASQPVALFALPIAVVGVGYLLGTTMGPSDIAALNEQNISRLLLTMPIEFAGGFIVGLAIVLGWTSSVEEKTEGCS